MTEAATDDWACATAELDRRCCVIDEGSTGASVYT